MSDPFVFFLTGASGSGKTGLVEGFEKQYSSPSIICLRFDTIGVPSEEEMIRLYGSGEEWQRAMTFKWVERIKKEYNNKKLVVIEGQARPSFIIEAFKKYSLDYKIILVHSCDKDRHYRLRHFRKQSHLINETMDNWSAYLKNQAERLNILIFDNSGGNLNEKIDELKTIIDTYDLKEFKTATTSFTSFP